MESRKFKMCLYKLLYTSLQYIFTSHIMEKKNHTYSEAKNKTQYFPPSHDAKITTLLIVSCVSCNRVR